MQYLSIFARIKSEKKAENPRSKYTWFTSRPPTWIFATRKMPPFHVESTRYHQKTTKNSNKSLQNMHKYRCPFPECTYETETVEDALAGVLLSVHWNGTHMSAPINLTATTQHSQTAKIEKVRRPTILAAGSNKDWSYFLAPWQKYLDATKVNGKDRGLFHFICTPPCGWEFQRGHYGWPFVAIYNPGNIDVI